MNYSVLSQTIGDVMPIIKNDKQVGEIIAGPIIPAYNGGAGQSFWIKSDDPTLSALPYFSSRQSAIDAVVSAVEWIIHINVELLETISNFLITLPELSTSKLKSLRE